MDGRCPQRINHTWSPRWQMRKSSSCRKSRGTTLMLDEFTSKSASSGHRTRNRKVIPPAFRYGQASKTKLDGLVCHTFNSEELLPYFGLIVIPCGSEHNRLFEMPPPHCFWQAGFDHHCPCHVKYRPIHPFGFFILLVHIYSAGFENNARFLHERLPSSARTTATSCHHQ